MRPTHLYAILGAALIFITSANATAQELAGASDVTTIFPAATPNEGHRSAWGRLFEPTEPLTSIADVPTISFESLQLPEKKEPPPPTPRSTGLRAFFRMTAADFAAFPRRPSTWVILGIGAGSALLAHPIDHQTNAHIVSSTAVGRFFAPGKWIGSAWVESGASLGLYFGGRYFVPEVEGQPRTNKYSHLGYDLLRAQVLSQAIVHGIKYTVRRDRPTGECCSFPSGHAATAFAVASVLERHLGYRAAWPTLVIATYVGASRLHDNRHYLSDVLFGAGIGVATGWTIVGRHGRNEYTMMPMPTRGGMMIAFTKQPGAPRDEARSSSTR